MHVLFHLYTYASVARLTGLLQERLLISTMTEAAFSTTLRSSASVAVAIPFSHPHSEHIRALQMHPATATPETQPATVSVSTLSSTNAASLSCASAETSAASAAFAHPTSNLASYVHL